MRNPLANKKGDVTITTIIIAALGLLVLVVLIMIFTGRLGTFTTGIELQQGDQSQCSSICSSVGNPIASVFDAKVVPADCKTTRTLASGKVCCCK